MSQFATPSLFEMRPSVGPLEEEILETLWRKRDSSPVRGVFVVLQSRRRIAYTTVMTVMDHLYQKGFLSRVKVKRSYVYTPIAKEQSLTTLSLRRIFSDLSTRYGRGVMFLTALSISIPKFPLIPVSVWYGMGLTFVVTLLGLSAVDLLQNLRVFGTFDYVMLLVSDPTLMKEHVLLSFPAIIESIPLINAATTTLSLVSAAILIRKLLKSVDRQAVSLHREGDVV